MRNVTTAYFRSDGATIHPFLFVGSWYPPLFGQIGALVP